MEQALNQSRMQQKRVGKSKSKLDAKMQLKILGSGKTGKNMIKACQKVLMLDGDNNEIENEQRAAEMLKLGVYSGEALDQAYVNIDQLDADKVEDMLKLADDSLIDVEYSQFVKQLQNHASSTPFKILKDLPRSLLSERQKMSEATVAET